MHANIWGLILGIVVVIAVCWVIVRVFAGA